MATIHGFELLRDEMIEEYKIRARIYRHIKSGAELLSMICPDENKVFGITFRTPPDDSTGVAHILEHSVLCGSRKFPVKEPFVELLKGSLQTFLNAFTYPDKTCYPVASQNLKDFYNLIDIYMDAALHPLIDELTFAQEAWHYELSRAEDPLIYKGVVFNEMKGVYASADSILSEQSQRVLFPETTYGVDYGGDPRHIPDLTWQQLKDFHARYYHPSNARIYFYGDDDPDERLRLMDEYLRHYDREANDSAIPLHPKKKVPEHITLPYPAGSQDANSYLTVNWRLDQITSSEEAMGLRLLDHILTKTPASPLRKALLDSGLGEDLAGVGLETQIREFFYSTGMKGIKAGEEQKVVDLITATLKRLASDGIDPRTIESSLNTEEFHYRELNTGNYPRGLALMIASMQTWLYDGDPLAPLRYSEPMIIIRERLKRGERYFEGLIKKWLIDNPQRTVLTLKPDEGLKNRHDREEEIKLASIKNNFNSSEIDAIIRATEELKKRQSTPDTPEALRCLPALTRADLDRGNRVIPSEPGKLEGAPYLYHDLFTQGIAYLDLGFDLSVVPAELIGLVPVWARALTETGTASEDYVSLAQRIGRLTGGIAPELYTTSMAENPNQGAAWIFLRGKAMDDRLPDLLGILHDVLAGPQFSLQDRIKQLIAEEKAELESNVIPGGSRFVAQRLRARFNRHDWIQEQLSGISYLDYLRKLSDRVRDDWGHLLAQLEKLHTIITARENMLINLTADRSRRALLESQLSGFIRSHSNNSKNAKVLFAEPAPHSDKPEALLIPAQVNYVGKSINLIRNGHAITGHSLVVNRYIRSAWLWDQVRVQGGAYGGFSMLDSRSGQLVLVSYRDPNLAKTLAIYDRTADYLRKLDIDEREVDQAVIGAIGDMDAYLLPDAKGFLALGRYLSGDSVERRQRLRNEILGTRLEHFHEFGHQLSALSARGQIAVMGSEEKMSELPGATKHRVL